MSWASEAKAKMEAARAVLVTGILILDTAHPELEVGTDEEKANRDARAELVLAVAAIDAALLFVTPFA